MLNTDYRYRNNRSSREKIVRTLRGAKFAAKRIIYAESSQSSLHGAPQIYDEKTNPANRYYTYEEWKLPEGAYAKLKRDQATICFTPDVAAHTRRIHARFVWSKEAPNHVNRAAPEDANGRLYRSIARISFPPKNMRGIKRLLRLV